MLNTELYRIPDPNKDSYSIDGNNNKGLIICASAADLTESSKVFLSKVLSAIAYDLNRDCVTISILPDSEISFSQITKELDISDVFIFGLNPLTLGLNIQVTPYVSSKMEQMRLLWSHSLSDLQSDKNKKIKLWQTLQQIFPNT